MKISVNWIKEFTDIKLSTEELVKAIGSQLGEIEEVTELGERYEKIVVAKVVECVQHPNADRLHVCKIDDGGVVNDVARDEQGYVQVVCGAPNVREGLTVAWLPPGATVPSSFEAERFVLEARELRGVTSNGMLASASELAISEDHSGLLELGDGFEPGITLIDALHLDDTIIDIENKMFTHRPDCFGILGVAREIAGIQNLKFTSPDWYRVAMSITKTTDELPLHVTNDIPELVPRFMMVPLANVTVGPSPAVVQSYLSRVGIKPINNIVDVTNLVMVLTAQPLHAFDYDKVAAQDNATEASVVVRHPKKGEKIALLNGKTIEPRNEAIMIASGKRLIAVGGVMGGVDTEVDIDTKNIILECASFDMYSIRRTAMAHGLFTDAVTRFNKGQSPLQNEYVLGYAVDAVRQVAGGHVAGKVQDLKHDAFHQQEVRLTPHFVNERLGLKLTGAEIASRLKNVEFSATHKGEDIVVMPPFWRTDIELPEDVVEEVGRLIGYDHLPLSLPKRDLTPTPKNPLLNLKSTVRSTLSRAGANELLTYSFVHGDLMDKVGQDKELAYQLSNALSPDLQYYRLSLLPSLLDKVHANIKAGTSEFAIFEINKSHDTSNTHEDGLPIEEERLALVFAADAKAQKQYHGSAYYQAKYYVETLLKQLGFENLVFEPSTTHNPKYPTGQQALAPFERNRTAYIKTTNGILLGLVGEFKASVRRNLKLPDYTAGFELDLLMLQEYQQTKSYKPLSRYPSTTQDISFKITDAVTYQALSDVVSDALQRAASEHGYRYELTPLDIYQEEKAKAHKHIAYRINLTHDERTLTTEEVNRLLDSVAEHAHKTAKATRL